MVPVPVLFLLSVLVPGITPVYLDAFRSKEVSRSKEQRKENNGLSGRRHGSFKSDQDILRYVKLFGTDMMIWRCKDAIQPYYDWKPIPLIELHCETIGVVGEFEWRHNNKPIDIKDDDHYSHRMSAHFANGQYYSGWVDFRLKIYNATTSDAGVYTFKATSGKGLPAQYDVYVDISIKKRKRGRYRKRGGRRSRKGLTRDYKRFYLFHKHQRERRKKGRSNENYGTKAIKTGKSTYYTI